MATWYLVCGCFVGAWTTREGGLQVAEVNGLAAPAHHGDVFAAVMRGSAVRRFSRLRLHRLASRR
jgi:hypothetical protein